MTRSAALFMNGQTPAVGGYRAFTAYQEPAADVTIAG